MAALILVVDDSTDALEATERFLAHKGIDVVTSTRAFGVTSLVLRRAPDVVVVDVMMPGIGGSALAQIIRTHAPKTPIIFYSAIHEAQGQALIREHSGARFVSKTHGVTALYRAIAAALTDSSLAIAR